MSADQYVMANANRCTIHPQHVMVDQGYSLPHCGLIYRCDCGEEVLNSKDEFWAQVGKPRP